MLMISQVWFLKTGILCVKRLPEIDENVQNLANLRGHVVAQPVKALHYKPEGRSFDSRYCY
jgi:hypothetical protein